MNEPHLIYRFGDFRLDLASRELHRAGKLLPLSPKMFDCLAWLFKHRARAVGRDELSAAVWNKVDVSDAQIDQLISKLRIALGDTGSDRELIRTVPRFGYRWVAEVQMEAPVAPHEAPETSPPTKGAPDRRRLALATGIGIAALLICIVAVTLLTPERHAATTRISGAPAENPVAPRGTPLSERIAVLPVSIDAEDDSEWAWLRLGLMDLISNRLRESGLTIVPASNIIALMPDADSRPPSPSAVQQATDARILVSPSVRKTSNGWRLHLELRGAEAIARELEVHADDAVSAARDASDRLLALLDASPPVSENTVGEVAELALMSRIEANIDTGHYEIAQQLLAAAPAALRDSASTKLREAQIQYFIGNMISARQLFQSVLDSDGLKPLAPATRGGALLGLGATLAEGAMPKFDEAIELAQRHHLSLLYIDAMRSRAALHGVLRQDAEADSDYAQARIAMELIGDTLGLAQMEVNQAGGLIVRQRYTEARPLLERAIARLQRFPSTQRNLVAAFSTQIFMHLALLEPRDALVVVEQAKVSLSRISNPATRAEFMVQEIDALIANGHLSEARKILDLLGSIDPREAAGAYSSGLIYRARLALASSQLKEAVDLAARAMEMRSAPALSTARYVRGRGAAWLVRTRALQRQGALVEAGMETQRFAAWAGTQEDSVVVVLVSLAQAEQAVAEHRPQDAINAYESALVAANRAAPADIAQVAISYGGYLIDSGQLDAATRIVGQVARWVGQDFGSALLQVQLYHALGQHKTWQEALASARSLAGERSIPDVLSVPPLQAARSTGRIEIAPTSPGARAGKNSNPKNQ